MASNFKKDLTTGTTTNKGAGDTVTGDVVTLPPDATDVVFTVVTDESVSGTSSSPATAELEMSYDKENWCPAITEVIGTSTGTTTTTFSNQNCVDTTITTGAAFKNKYASGKINYDATGAKVSSGALYDAHYQHINKDDSFNLSMWLASDELPSATYEPVIWRHGGHDEYTNQKSINLNATGTDPDFKNKYLSAPANITYDTFTKCLEVSDSTDTGAFLEIENTCGSGSSDFHDGNHAYSATSTKSWTMSFWYKSPSNSVPNSTSVSRYMANFGHSWGLYLGTDGKFYLDNLYVNAEMIMPTGINLFDGNWHHVTFTWRHDSGGSTTASNYKTTANNATDPGSSLFIDGQPCTTPLRTAYHTLPPFIVSDMGIAGYNPGLSSAVGSVPGRYAHLAIETGAQVAADASARYNTGVPTDLSSTVPIYINFENDSNDSGTSSISSSTNLDEQGTGHNSSGTPDSDYPSVVHGSIFSIATLSDTNMKAQINRDIFHEKMGADKSFTINTWFNSSNPPVTTSTEGFGVTKYLDCNNETNKSASFDQRMRTGPIFWDSSASTILCKPTTNWSVSFWFKYTDSSPYGTIWDMRNPDDANKRMILYTGSSSNYLFFFVRYGSGGSYVQENYGSSAKALLLDGSWHHVVITNAASSTSTNGTMGGTTTNLKLWIDGVCKSASGTDTMGDWSTTTNNLRMVIGNSGSESLSLNQYLPIDHGLSNVSTWTVDLASDISGTSSAKISSLYDNGPTDLTNETGLLNWFRCGDAAGDNLYDASDATNAYLRDSKGTAKLVPETTTDGSNWTQGWSSTSYGTLADASSESIAVATTYSYTDDYLPVLFNNGAKTTVPAVTGNTKYFDVVGDNYTSYIEVDGIVSNSIIRNTSDWTVSFWYKGTDTQGDYWTTSDSGCQFYISSGNLKCQVKSSSGGSTSGWFNGASTLTDGNWHMVTVTFKKVASDGDTWYFDPIYSSQAADAAGITLYIDGARQAWTGSATNTTHDFTGGSNKFRWCGRQGFNWDTPVGNYDQLAIFSEFKSATQVAAMYDGTAGTAGGKQVDLSTSGSWGAAAISLLNADSDSSLSNGDTLTNDGTGSHTTTVTMGTVGHIDVANLGTSETIYKLPVTAYDTFGNGLTISFTKKLGSGTTWNPAGTETTKLLLSFDGFEDTADAFNAYDASSIIDGNYHNLQITWDGAASSSPPTDTQDVKVFVDGSELTKVNTLNKIAANKHFKYTTGTFVPGTFGASGWAETGSENYKHAYQGAFDELSLHSEALEGSIIYNLGAPLNYLTKSSIDNTKIEGWWRFEETASASAAVDSSGNNISLTLNNIDTGDWSNLTYDSIKQDTQVKGAGITLSLTRNLWKNTSTDKVEWVTTQDKDPMLVVSFNGLEKYADHWIAYACTLSTPNVNILDGDWHNIVLSYRGTTWTNANAKVGGVTDKVRFGPAGSDAYHFNLCINGTDVSSNLTPQLTVVDSNGSTINNAKGFSLAKPYNDGNDNKLLGEIVIENKHLRFVPNANEVYKPTAYLADGITQVSGVNSKHAFQGKIDETSFHAGKNTASVDSSWWTAAATFSTNKPSMIYGNNGAGNVLSTRYQPYNLTNPSEAFTESAENISSTEQYIDPVATSSTNAEGMELYYRWGDNDGDCSTWVWDTATKNADSVDTARNLEVKFFGEAQKLDLSSVNDLIAGSGSPQKSMKIDSQTTTTGGTQNMAQNPVKHDLVSANINTCLTKHVNAPKLPHFRVKWSGGGSAQLGENGCKTALWYRSNK